MALHIDYYVSLNSPWTYFGAARIEAMAMANNATLRIYPVDFAAIFAQSGGLPLPKRAPQRQAYRMQALRRWRDHLNIPIHLEPAFFPVTRRPPRAVSLHCAKRPATSRRSAGAPGAEGAVAGGSQPRRSCDTGQIDRGYRPRCRCRDRPGQRPALGGGREADSGEALDRGVFGAPSYVIADEIFWGQDRLDFVERKLAARLMRVYTILPQRDWRDVAPAARAAEAAGFDALMTVELGHDPLAPLAFAALATERVELTPSVVVAFPRSPTTLAQQAWDIQANSGGRFVLGLGSQVKGHNERRFGIAWTAPAPRMRDYVMALRAVWRAWETRGQLNFDSPHYKLTLMTPDFSPEPTGLPMVPVTVAAVGEAMLRVAGQMGDGVRLHPLCSRAYLEQVCLPQMMEGMRRSGRSRLNFDVHGGGFVCTGPDEATVAAEMEKARRRIGFYGSTRTYFRSWRCMGWRIWERNCIGCRWRGSGIAWARNFR